jgi:YidC/Oxa1 family membrane protein insertase
VKLDKNTVIGFILMALVFFGFMFYEGKVQKDRAEQMQQQQVVDAVAQQKSDSIKNIVEEKKAKQEIAQMTDSTNSLFVAHQKNE